MSAFQTIDSKHKHHDSINSDAMMSPVRTTVTLDPDVEARLRAAMRERDVSFKVALNDAVRAGLGGSALVARPYKMPTAPLGVSINIDKALTIAGEMEDEEILRKIEEGK
jgi:hypothetical protein